MFDRLYEVKPEDRAPFGPYWKGPEWFTHGDWHIVAEYPKDPEDGDGQVVRLHECRMPARFYKIEALPTPNSVGEVRPGFSISTGSGTEMLELAVRLAKKVSRGMIRAEVRHPHLWRLREALELLDGLEPDTDAEKAILSGAFDVLLDLEGRSGKTGGGA